MKNNSIKSLNQHGDFLNLLRFYKDIDKTEISRKLGLSMPTIYKSLEDLSKLNVLTSTKSSITLNTNYGTLIGISIGASLCKIVFMGFDFELFNSKNFLKFKSKICNEISQILYDDKLLNECKNNIEKNYIYFKTPKEFSVLKNTINILLDCLKHWILEGTLNVLSIGISCTGIINNNTQTILDAYNLSYLSNRTIDSLIYPDKHIFFKSENIFITIIQNSNASVIAEKIHLQQINSFYKNNKNIVTLYLGVGIGAGFYLGRLYEGTNGFTGEIGHIKAPIYEAEKPEVYNDLISRGVIDKECTCGSNDCYDYKIRSYVFKQTANKFYDMSADDIKNFLIENPENAKLLGKYYGNMINTIIGLLDIDLVIFTGKIYKSMNLILNHIDSTLDQSPLKFNRNDCKICTSEYGPMSSSIGAAIYAYHKKYNLELSWEY